MVRPEDLPPPKTGPVVSNRSLTLPFEGQTPRVPPGFTATAGFVVRWDRERQVYMVVEAAPVIRRDILTYALPDALARLHARGWRTEAVLFLDAIGRLWHPPLSDQTSPVGAVRF